MCDILYGVFGVQPYQTQSPQFASDSPPWMTH